MRKPKPVYDHVALTAFIKKAIKEESKENPLTDRQLIAMYRKETEIDVPTTVLCRTREKAGIPVSAIRNWAYKSNFWDVPK